jgi:hypothetical protein
MKTRNQITPRRIWAGALSLVTICMLLTSLVVSAAQIGDSAIGERWCGDGHEPDMMPTDNHADGWIYERSYHCTASGWEWGTTRAVGSCVMSNYPHQSFNIGNCNATGHTDEWEYGDPASYGSNCQSC